MEVIQHYGLVDADGFITQCNTPTVPEEGPPPDLFRGRDFRLLAEKPNWGAQPSPLHRLKWVGYSVPPEWVMPELEALKAYKRAEITAARLAADADHFTYQGVKIRTADKDMNDLLVADARISKGQGMPPNWPGGWIGVDGIVQISTKEAWDPFFIAMYDAGVSNFMYSQQLKAEIEDAASTEQILAINWEGP